MKVKIDIDTRTFVRFWLVIIGFVLVGLAIYSARTALVIIGASVFLAIALSPVVNKLVSLLPNKKGRTLGTALSYLLVLAFLGLIIFIIVPPIIEQTANFAKSIPGVLDNMSTKNDGLMAFVEKNHLTNEFNDVIASVKSSATKFASGLGSVLFVSISSALSALASIILVLVLAFLMLIEGPKWMKMIWSSYKDQKLMKSHKNVVTKMYSVVTSYVTGQLTVSSIAGIVSGVVVFVLSLIFAVPMNLAIPAVAIVFISSLIPFFGATVGAILISLALVSNSLTAAIIFMIFFIVYQQVEGNFISPKIQSKKIDLTPLLILIALAIGLYMFGIIGGIISIPIAGCIKVLIEEWIDVRKKEKEEHLEKLELKNNN